MKHYAGLDVSMKTTSICVRNQDDEILFETTVATDLEEITETLKPFQLERIGLESGSLCHWLTRELQALGLPAICIDARAAAAYLAVSGKKTDKNDARNLALIMVSGRYLQVHAKSQEACARKALIVARAALVEQRVRMTNTIRGLLKAEGVRLAPGTTRNFADRVRLACQGISRLIQIGIESLLRSFLLLEEEISRLDREVNQIAKEDPIVKQLMTTPGIGPITAVSYLAELDDLTRFADSHTVGAYLGLTPNQYQSGETAYRGRISRRGPKGLRALLVEAAIVLLTRTKSYSRLKAWGLKLKAKKGLMKAAVAVARKLGVIMHRMTVTGTDFQYGDQKGQQAKAA